MHHQRLSCLQGPNHNIYLSLFLHVPKDRLFPRLSYPSLLVGSRNRALLSLLHFLPALAYLQ